MLPESTSQVHADFTTHGVALAPSVIAPERVASAAAALHDVVAGRYATGIAPTRRTWNPGDDPHALVKINDAHLCDDELFSLISDPHLGKCAASATQAEWVQVWAVQLLLKPPGGSAATVGWHQDRKYWPYFTPESELFTAWIALSDVTADSGPVRFVRGSQHWGELEDGDFYSPNLAELQRAILAKVPPELAQWNEIAGILPPGGVSLHHRLTVHGSSPNRSPTSRLSLAVHMRTNRSWVQPGADHLYVQHLHDPRRCPVIFRR